MIIADNISKSYDSNIVINNLSFTLPDKGIIAITGMSGSGKTTLIRLISGLEEPDSGSIVTNGKVSVVFQENRLFPWLNVRDNILLTKSRQTDISNLLKELNLENEDKKMPLELSGGMQRRVEIARALISDFDVLILDEPFNGLDEINIKKVTSLLVSVSKEKLILLITHDKNYVKQYADKVIEVTISEKNLI